MRVTEGKLKHCATERDYLKQIRTEQQTKAFTNKMVKALKWRALLR